ncbi:MAG: hypothetical protein WD314_13150 [Trueperaceae bacterium]
MTGGCRNRGVALAAALLTLAAVATLVLGNTLVAQLDLKLAANRQALALGRAQARSRMTLFLLQLEADSQTARFPETAPAMEGVLAYRRDSDTTATASVVAGGGRGGYRSDVRIELHQHGAEWRIHIDQIR